MAEFPAMGYFSRGEFQCGVGTTDLQTDSNHWNTDLLQI